MAICWSHTTMWKMVNGASSETANFTTWDEDQFPVYPNVTEK